MWQESISVPPFALQVSVKATDHPGSIQYPLGGFHLSFGQDHQEIRGGGVNPKEMLARDELEAFKTWDFSSAYPCLCASA